MWDTFYTVGIQSQGGVMSSLRIFFAALAVGALLPVVAQAFELSDVKINGFVSQGYIYSADNNFLSYSKSTNDGSFQFNEVGINVQSQINDKLRVGAQFLSRDLGKDGNNDVKLDWGYADYRWQDYLGVRIGKVKLPFGLYNEGRDTDVLRPMIFLPQSIYDENKRDILVSYQGVGLYGNVPVGPVGDIDYTGFIGTVNFDEDSVFIEGIKQNLTHLVKNGGHNPEYQLLSVDMQNKYITGCSATLNTALQGLRFGISYLRVENDFEYTSTNPNRSSVDGYLSNHGAYVLSMEYSIGDLVIAGEYSELEHRNSIFPSDTGGTEAKDFQSYYGMISYAVTKPLTVSLLYDIFYADLHDKDGDNFAAHGMPKYMGWRKDLGVGLRYDVNSNWTLKAEYHYIDGVAQNMTVYNDASDLQRYWNYVAMKASFNF
jgi:opacity protein-like surface antigen